MCEYISPGYNLHHLATTTQFISTDLEGALAAEFRQNAHIGWVDTSTNERIDVLVVEFPYLQINKPNTVASSVQACYLYSMTTEQTQSS